MKTTDGKKIKCDFCTQEVKVEDATTNSDPNGMWSWGEQGKVWYYGVSGFAQAYTKDCCPGELCKARLLVWTRS